MEFLPKPDQAKGVQIDDQADRIGLRFPVEVGLVGDARATLAALNQFIETKDDRSFLENAQTEMQDWWKLMETHDTILQSYVFYGNYGEKLFIFSTRPEWILNVYPF